MAASYSPSLFILNLNPNWDEILISQASFASILSISINWDPMSHLLLLLLLFVVVVVFNLHGWKLPWAADLHFMHFFQLICLVASCSSLLPDPVTLWPTSHHTAVSSRVPCALWLLSQPLSGAATTLIEFRDRVYLSLCQICSSSPSPPLRHPPRASEQGCLPNSHAKQLFLRLQHCVA